MSQDMDSDIEGRVRGRTAGLHRAVVARLKRIVAATIVGGVALSLAITLSASAGKHFEYSLLRESYGTFLLLGGLLALFTWWRYRDAVRRLPGKLARSAGQPEGATTDLGRWYSQGSLGPSTSWEKPSLAGEEDQDPNRPAR